MSASNRRQIPLRKNWAFQPGDQPVPAFDNHDGTYMATKAGFAPGWASPLLEYDAWRRVSIPHDWTVETDPSPENNVSQGFRTRGIGWYRTSFRLDSDLEGQHIELQFDGVATHCTVWVNGIIAARNFCGYTSFSADITSFARFGDEPNQVAVRVDANEVEGWWYEGAGIYRDVRIVTRPLTHIVTDGLLVRPTKSGEGWQVLLEAEVANHGATASNSTLDFVILDPNSQVVAKASQSVTVDPLSKATASQTVSVSAPHLWSVDAPHLYRVEVTLTDQESGNGLDQDSHEFGFRTIRFDANEGFFLNDEPLKIKGTCNHQDAVAFGVAVPDSLWEWRIRKLKEMGSNAYRCAHHPPAKAFLQAADRLGMLVMDENRVFNCTAEYVRQLEWMVKRDRNHASVFMWSVFNEEPMQASRSGYEMVRRMAHVVKSLDPTRPVTAAINNGHLSEEGVSHAVDVVGFNYNHHIYDEFHQKFPTIPVLSSEDTSAVMTRGEFVTDHQTNFTIASYDEDWQPWGLSHRQGWQEVATRPYMAGAFVWTGFDYRGEPQPLVWPSTGSSFGCMDQCGFPKTAYYIHQAHWISDRPILHLAPHWNHPEGTQEVRVMVISNLPVVQLELNGEPVGEVAVDPYQMAYATVPYRPGKLTAHGYSAAGEKAASFSVETTGPAVALKLVSDRTVLKADHDDTIPVTVKAVDAEGRVVPGSNPLVSFIGSGRLVIRGAGNGDPICHESDVKPQRSLYHGLAQVMIQCAEGQTDVVTLTASAEGLQSDTLVLTIG